MSFTCKGGYTPAVRSATKDAIVVRKIKAELLPLRDAQGTVIDYEEVPELLWSASGRESVTYLYAWENVFGGNWEGMKKKLEGATRKKILWMAYGIAEGSTDVVFSQFRRAAHVMPLERLPKDGTWFLIADPETAKRNWFMAWFKISSSGISFQAREWPQEDDAIPGHGFPGAWALPSTGKRLDGDEGPAQLRVIHSFGAYAEEIERVEKQIETLEMKLHGKSDIANRSKVVRIMDSRFANQDGMSSSISETPLEAMEGLGYNFFPSGKAGGGEGTRTLNDRSQFVSDMLDYDEAQAELDVNASIYTFKGKAPIMRVASCCTNTIFSYENWTNGDGNAGKCKDPMDVVGIYATCRPEYENVVQRGWH